MLPRAVAEGRRIARNIHRLGRLYLTKTVYAGVPDPRRGAVRLHLPVPAAPAHGRGDADDRHPLVRAGARAERGTALSRPAAPGAGRVRRPGGNRDRGRLAALVRPRRRRSSAARLDEGRTAATTTLIVLGLAFILLLERGPGREHIAIQSYMLAMVTALGALYALILAARAACATSSSSSCSPPGSGSSALLSVAAGLVVASALWRLPYIQHLERDENGDGAVDRSPATPLPEPTHGRVRRPGGRRPHPRPSPGRSRPRSADGRSPPDQDRRHDRPRLARRRRSLERADLGRRRRLPAQLLPRRRARATPRTSSGSAPPAR